MTISHDEDWITLVKRVGFTLSLCRGSFTYTLCRQHGFEMLDNQESFFDIVRNYPIKESNGKYYLLLQIPHVLMYRMN
jgi:hypothetical protein